MRRWVITIMVVLGLLGVAAPQAHAALFFPSTVPELINAIDTANVTVEDDVIDLGGLTFTLSSVNNITDGANGLPVISGGGGLTIQNGTITRSSAAPGFRILDVGTGGSLTLDQVVISGGNTGAVFGVPGGGGGILNQGSLDVQSSTVQSNTASQNGGGVYNLGTLSVTDSTFTNNMSATGGGIEDTGTLATITSSTISNNIATSSGGGVLSQGTLNVANSTVSGNSAGGEGGGVMTVTSATVTNSTIADNFSGTEGGGMWVFGALDLTSSIVAINSATVSSDINGSATTASFNLIGTDSGHNIVNGLNDNQVGTDVAPLDPLLGPLANNGGPTQTHAPAETSPALNAGANPVALLFDQRGVGFSRVDSGQADVGAIELQLDTDDDGLPNDQDNCPDVANGADVDPITPGVQQEDTDNDGMGDACDVIGVTAHVTGSGTVASSPAGITCPSICSASFDEEVILTATPDAGFAFNGWSGDCSGVSTCVIDPDQHDLDRDVTATFVTAPHASISNVRKKEGDRGTRTFVFKVTLNHGATGGESVDFHTENGSAEPDDLAPVAGTITFAPSQTVAEAEVRVFGDRRAERNEKFKVLLSNPSGMLLEDDSGTGVIVNDDDGNPHEDCTGVCA